MRPKKTEKIVSLSELGLFCRPIYFEKNVPKALNDCYARKNRSTKTIKHKGIFCQIMN